MRQNETPATNGGDAKARRSRIPRLADFPRLARLGCPAGCIVGSHECGVGRPVKETGRNGRHLSVQEREYYGLRTLQMMRGAV